MPKKQGHDGQEKKHTTQRMFHLRRHIPSRDERKAQKDAAEGEDQMEFEEVSEFGADGRGSPGAPERDSQTDPSDARV